MQYPLLTHHSKVTTPCPSRGRQRHIHENSWGDGKEWTEERLDDLTKYNRKCRDCNTFGYICKELYIRGRNVHVEEKMSLADVCKHIHKYLHILAGWENASKQTNFNINYFFNYELTIIFLLNREIYKTLKCLRLLLVIPKPG